MRHSRAAAPPVPFHALRAGMLAGAAAALAAGAHVIGGDALPVLPVLLALVTLTVMAATAATRLRLNTPAILAALAGAQIFLHEAFTVLGTPRGVPLFVPSAGHNGHSSQEHAEALNALPAIGEAVAGHAGNTAGAGMLLAHAAATVICALLLAHGEAALWALAAWLRPLALLPEAVAPDAGPSPAPVGPPPSFPFRPWRNLRQNSRRGPPPAVAVF